MANKKTNKTNGLGRKQSMSGFQLLVYALIFGLIGGLISYAAFAAPANKPGAGSSATVTATPNPTTAGSHVYLTGCGYTVGVPASVKVLNSTGSLVNSFSQPMGEAGCLSNGYFLAGTVDTYTILMYQSSSTHKHATNLLKATTVLTVQ
jgi:hypothetical protein